MDQYQAFIDGGSRGNPGNSASAFALSLRKQHIVTKGRYVGLTTNNVAEYLALSGLVLHLRGMKYGKIAVDVFCDSLLVVNQMRGVWRTKDKNLSDLRYRIIGEVENCGITLRLKHIPRERNTEADKAVNRVLDQVETLSKQGLPDTAVEMEWDHPLTCTAAQWDSKFFTNL